MIDSARQLPRWHTNEYCTIVSAKYDSRNGLLAVSFANGDAVQLDPAPLVPPTLEDVDWWRVASNDHELVVPHAQGWFEIPWDVVRMQTDAEFDAHMTRPGRANSEQVKSTAA
jgi:hypothetical protein